MYAQMQHAYQPWPRYQAQYKIYTGQLYVQALQRAVKLAVVVLTEESSNKQEPFFVVPNFRTEVLSAVEGVRSPLKVVSDETFKRALAAMQVVQVTCSGGKAGIHTEVVDRLKAHEIIGSRSSQVKLAALKGLLPTMMHLKLAERVSKQISDRMYGLVPADVLIDRPGQHAVVLSTSTAHPANTASPSASHSMNAALAATSAAQAAVQMFSGALVQNLGAAVPATIPAAPTSQLAAHMPAHFGGVPGLPQMVYPQQQQQQHPLLAPSLVPLATATATAASHQQQQLGTGLAAAAPPFTPTPTGVDLTMVATAVLAAATAAANAATRQPNTSRGGGHVQGDIDVESEPLPYRLPRRCYSIKQLYGPYSLQAYMPDWRCRTDVPFNQELQALKAASTEFNLGRGGMRRVRERTWESLEKHLIGAMGYLYVHATPPVPAEQLSVRRLTPVNIIYYIDFLIARNCKSGTIIKCIGAMKRVLQWWQIEWGEDMHNWMYWLENLQKEVPKECVASTRNAENRNIPSVADFLRFQLKVESHARGQLQLDIQRWGRMKSHVTAKAAYDMAKLSFKGGYGPPVRDTWLLTARHPKFKDSPCMNLDCKRLGCAGDRLERCAASEPGKYKVVIEHSKTEDHHNGEPTTFILPPTWTKAVEAWVEQGHSILAADCECLFPHIGNIVKQSSFANHWQWFSNLQAAYSMALKISPQQCRHMFVGERMGEQAVPGPSAQAAAIIMGNSRERWAISYDVRRRDRLAAEAMRDSEEWRQELLLLLEEKPAEEDVEEDDDEEDDDAGVQVVDSDVD